MVGRSASPGERAGVDREAGSGEEIRFFGDQERATGINKSGVDEVPRSVEACGTGREFDIPAEFLDTTVANEDGGLFESFAITENNGGVGDGFPTGDVAGGEALFGILGGGEAEGETESERERRNEPTSKSTEHENA